MVRQLVRDAHFPRTPGVYAVYDLDPPDERPPPIGVAAMQSLCEQARGTLLVTDDTVGDEALKKVLNLPLGPAD